jgi:hypothetical protein
MLEKAKGAVESIAEQVNEEEEVRNVRKEQDPSKLAENCSECKNQLSEDEATINQRFIEQMLLESVNGPSLDQTPFPLCVKCHFE